jgi:hypothetical protein
MKQPKNQIAEVLYLLLEQDRTSLDIIKHGVLNPTSKISQLRNKGVVVLCDNVQHTNKFGRKMKYGKFSVLNFKDSVKIYNQINK